MKKFIVSAAVVFGAFAFALTTNAAFTWTPNQALIKVGSRGAQVMDLQACLAQLGYNPNSNIDGIFGNITKSAVMSFQASKGVAVDGIIGNVTGPLYQAACAGETGTGTGTETGNNNSGDFNSNGNGEEADLTFSLMIEDDITEDSSEQHAFTIEIEAEDDGGAAMIERLDLQLVTELGGNDVRSYRAITGVTLEVDGKEIAQADTDRRGDWRGSSDDMIRFTGLDLVIDAGEVLEIEVLLDVTDKADSVTLADIDYRYVDEAGLVISENLNESVGPISIIAPEGLDFRFTKNRNSPSDTTLDVSSATSNTTLVIADVEVRKGVEGTVEEAEVKVTFTGAADLADVKALVSRFAIEIDGDQVDTINASSLVGADYAGGVVTLVFDLDEFEVEEEDEFEIEVLANFRAYEDSISKVRVTNLALAGYDDAADEAFDFSDATSTVTFAAEYTITEGDIEVNIDDSTVAVGAPIDTTTPGTIEFEVTVENNTGSTLEDLLTPGTWEFDVKGYGGVTVADITFEEGDALDGGTDMLDGTETTFTVELEYTHTVTNQSFSIEIESIDGINIGYLWND